MAEWNRAFSQVTIVSFAASHTIQPRTIISWTSRYGGKKYHSWSKTLLIHGDEKAFHVANYELGLSVLLFKWNCHLFTTLKMGHSKRLVWIDGTVFWGAHHCAVGIVCILMASKTINTISPCSIMWTPTRPTIDVHCVFVTFPCIIFWTTKQQGKKQFVCITIQPET